MPENPLAVLIPLVLLACVLQAIRQMRRVHYIRTYQFPPGLMQKLARRRPGLAYRDMRSTGDALRQFFLAYLKSGRKPVAMPSQVADDLWHEFILYTRHYDAFCRRAFGRFLHHTPAAVMDRRQRASNAGLRRVWWQACLDEKIDPRKPARLPLLFALDAKLGIADGFVYSLDCHAHPGAGREGSAGGGQCASDFSDSSFDGSTDGMGCGGHGDGGDGCGGGCGGD